MKILSWNLRGLGAKVKKSALRKLINSHSPKFVFIQETKLESIKPGLINSIWNNNDTESAFSPSIGQSGGLISMWSTSYFSCDSVETQRHWIAISGCIQSIKFPCTLINIYNPCCPEDRSLVWSELTSFCSNLPAPCLIIGDFNETLAASERGNHFLILTAQKISNLFCRTLVSWKSRQLMANSPGSVDNQKASLIEWSSNLNGSEFSLQSKYPY